VPPTIISESAEPSVLADFDTWHVLDALSCGIIVLDRQLCAIYANVIAQDLLALHLPGMRGQPFVQFRPQTQRFACAVRRAVGGGSAVDCILRIARQDGSGRADWVNARIAPLCNEMSGTYVMVELSARMRLQRQGPALL